MALQVLCKDCKKVFTITDQEQKWYEEKMKTNPTFTMPKRCKECREKNKQNRGGNRR